MPTLNYTSVARVYDQEPAIETISDLTSAHVYSFGEDAEAEINAALARNYTIPVTGSPPILQTIATDITIYRILSRRVFSQERLQASTWPNAFKESRDLLKALVEGNSPLVNSAGTVITARTDLAQATSNTENYTQTFSELNDIEAVIDPDKRDDLRDERDLSIDVT